MKPVYVMVMQCSERALQRQFIHPIPCSARALAAAPRTQLCRLADSMCVSSHLLLPTAHCAGL